jgi:hypothetical protein
MRIDLSTPAMLDLSTPAMLYRIFQNIQPIAKTSSQFHAIAKTFNQSC